jgi:predicted enzyme related to lactoylglutathione lyase
MDITTTTFGAHMTGSSGQGIKTVLHSVSDLATAKAVYAAAGATVQEPAHDVGGCRLMATVTDPDGNVLGLLQDR